MLFHCDVTPKTLSRPLERNGHSIQDRKMGESERGCLIIQDKKRKISKPYVRQTSYNSCGA